MATVDIPKQQRAAVKVGSGSDAKAPAKDVEVQMPNADQILVKINWTGLCASDKSLIHDEWSAFGVAMKDETKGIAGHEGAGVVVAVGDNMHNRWKVGDRAGIKWVRIST
jgi:alcohol dehydrogenase, propanol-preferring